MLFGKKRKNLRKCENCGVRSEANFSFCPHCGNDFFDPQKEQEEYGLLGRNDFTELEEQPQLGMMDKMISSMFDTLMKNFDKQFRNQFNEFDGAEVRALPNGIRINISGPMGTARKPVKKVQVVKRELDESQLKKISSLPRAQAKTSVKRFGDKVVYELTTPGVNSAENVFVSKLENGYEIKAIGEKKVYVNSVPINLPLKKYSILKNKLSMEFVDMNARAGQE